MLYSLSWYQLPWSFWIRQWKFQQDLACGELLCQQLALACQHFAASGSELPQAICYVPISKERKKERGFNQAQQLASVMAKYWQVPLLDIFHSKRSQHQVGLNRQQRRANLRRQFRLRQRVKLPQHVALVDDVITTGATIDQLCRLLRAHKVQRIDVWTLAITPADRTAHQALSHHLHISLGRVHALPIEDGHDKVPGKDTLCSEEPGAHKVHHAVVLLQIVLQAGFGGLELRV